MVQRKPFPVSCSFVLKWTLEKLSISFSPLIKLTDRLLLVGVISDEDVQKLLIMIDPETWNETFEKGKIY